MVEKDALVDRVKSIQRSDVTSKQQWWDYCDKHLGGVKDPSRHDAKALQDFVTAHSSGQLPPSALAPPAADAFGRAAGPLAGLQPWLLAASFSAAAGDARGGRGRLQDWVKTGQRQSRSLRTSWQSYCSACGSKHYDPAKHPDSFIVGFMDYLGQLAVASLASEEGADAEQRPGLPGRRVAADCEKVALVEKVKSLQRTDVAAKAAWWAYCDEHAKGVRDPDRHEKESLLQFVSGYP